MANKAISLINASDKELAEMNDKEYKQRVKEERLSINEKKATDERRASAKKNLQVEKPESKMVEDDDGKLVEVQTNTDTKDPNEVPNTLNGKIPNESGKKEGEKTTQTGYAESVINDIENGEKGSNVGKTQIKEVWGGKVGNDDENVNVEEPSKNDKGDEVPSTEEVIDKVEETSGEDISDTSSEGEEGTKGEDKNKGKDDGGGDKTYKETEKKIDLIRRGIWADYSNGLFGDDDTKGIPYDKLTPEQKKRRNQALSLAWRYTLDNIGTMLWNIGSAFGRKDTFIDNEYAKLLRKQNENLVQNDTDLMKAQKEFELKLSQSKQFNNMSHLDQQAYLTFLMLDPSANKDNLLSARNLEQFEKYKLEIESNAVKSSYLGNEKMQATIKNLIKDLDVKNADINKINADISRIAVENKLTEQQIQQILLECEAMQKRIGYIDAHEIADIVGKYGQFANDVTGSVANVLNAFKPALNINKTTRTSPKVTQPTTETTVNETTKKK